MRENLPSTESLSSDDTETPKKKKKITSEMPYKEEAQEEVQNCLLSLFEEDSSPESTDNINQLIQQQHKPPAKAQEKHHLPAHETKTKTETNSNANRIKLTLFKPGFELETETELAKAFKRPIRKFKEDTPFYPWLPSITPLVNFHLNYKG